MTIGRTGSDRLVDHQEPKVEWYEEYDSRTLATVKGGIVDIRQVIIADE